MFNPLKPIILCVDDDQEILNLVRIYLNRHYYVLTAKTGDEALTQILTRRKPDLILLDIMLADLDGFTVCNSLQNNPGTASIPVIFMSSLDQQATASRVYDSGAIDYLTKPFSREELLERVAKHIELPVFWHRQNPLPAVQRKQEKDVSFQEELDVNAGTNEAMDIEQNELGALPTRGLLLITGSPGAGQTATVHKVLGHWQGQKILTVAQPDGQALSFATPCQGDEEDWTYEQLLKRAITQQPDVLYVDRIGNYYTARVLLEFAKSGKMVVALLPQPTPWQALEYLTGLGLNHQDLATTLINMIHHVGIRRLCPYCKSVQALSRKESRLLSGYSAIPNQVARPTGCSRCQNSGYLGYVYLREVIEVNFAIKNQGKPQLKSRLANLVMAKIYSLSISVSDAYQVFQSAPRIADTEPFHRPTTILVVDDDSDHNNLVKAFLTEQDYAVICASNGVEALLSLAKYPVDLILADIEMPAMDGFQMAKIGHQKGIAVPIIFVTGKSSQASVISALQLGAVDYVVKPIKKSVLLEKIARILNQ